MLKGFLSVLAGLGLYMVLFVVVIWGLDTIFPVPPTGPSMGRIVAHVVLVGLAAFGGGMLTASVAPGKPMLHALSFAALIFLLTLPDLLRGPAANEPALYPLLVSAAVVVGALAGGSMATRSSASTSVAGTS